MLSASVIAKANALKILNSEGIKEGKKKSYLLIGGVLREEGYHQKNNYVLKSDLLQFVKRKIGFYFKKDYWPK